MEDLTVVYYTANLLSKHFHDATLGTLLNSLHHQPLITVSQRPMEVGENIVVDFPISHVSIYRQMLIGAKSAHTEYIAFAEDDVLYSAEHFKHRPTKGKFAYNIAVWGIYTWVMPALFSYKRRRNNHSLICERDLFIEAMEERFAKYADESTINKDLWAEPGKYERQLGVTQRESEMFYSGTPNIMFSHEEALSYHTIGKRKRLGEVRALEIPYWGRAEDILKYYESV